MFTYKNGISNNLNPEEIIMGSQNLDHNKLKIKFGSYAQVYICTTNKTNQTIVGEISLRSESEWGGYYFMSLAIGRQVHSYI